MQGEKEKAKEALQVEVPVIDAEVVQYIRGFAKRGWGSRRIASELGIARDTARRYMASPQTPVGLQTRRGRRRMNEEGIVRAAALWAAEAAGNAVVVQRLLAAEGIMTSLRTVQRAVQSSRIAKRNKDVVTVRFETAPGEQMQIDFGQKKVLIGGTVCRVFLFVAVLGFSRRMFVMASLSERQEDWQEGVSKAFMHFGGCTRSLLIDNPKAMVLSHERRNGVRQICLHPAFAEFCKDWQVVAKACAPSRARTKGKVENGVGYVKHNALAGLSFTSFAALQAHLDRWLHQADRRIHGTMKKRPVDVFEAEERAALSSLPQRPMPARTRRLKRKVANDCYVNVDTVRYSVPHRFVGTIVTVEVGDTQVRIFDVSECIASHDRCQEMHRRVTISGHFAGLLRPVSDKDLTSAAHGECVLAEMGRTLNVYEQIVEGAAQ